MPLRDVFRDLTPVLLVRDGGIPGIQQGLNEFQSGGELSTLGGRRESSNFSISACLAREADGASSRTPMRPSANRM